MTFPESSRTTPKLRFRGQLCQSLCPDSAFTCSRATPPSGSNGLLRMGDNAEDGRQETVGNPASRNPLAFRNGTPFFVRSETRDSVLEGYQPQSASPREPAGYSTQRVSAAAGAKGLAAGEIRDVADRLMAFRAQNLRVPLGARQAYAGASDLQSDHPITTGTKLGFLEHDFSIVGLRRW